MSIYENDVVYKFQLVNGIYYTAKVVEEDSSLIKIRTTRGEEFVIGKQNIIQSKIA